MGCDLTDKCWWQLCFKLQVADVDSQLHHAPGAPILLGVAASLGKVFKMMTEAHVPLVVVESLSCVQLFATPWAAESEASLSFTVSRGLLKLMFIESVMPSNHFILYRPFLLLSSIFPSTRVFSSELALCIRWLKCWSVRFSISPSNEYSGLISFRIDWFEPLAIQVTLRSLLQQPQFESINCLVLSLLCGPTLTFLDN